MLFGVGGGKKFAHFRAGLREERFERGVVIVRLRGEAFFGDVRPEMQTLAEESDVLGGIFGEAEVREKKARGAEIEDGVEGLIPDGEIDIRRRSGGHDVGAVGDADAGGVSGERNAFLGIEVGDVVARVAGSVEDFEFSLAAAESEAIPREMSSRSASVSASRERRRAAGGMPPRGNNTERMQLCGLVKTRRNIKRAPLWSKVWVLASNPPERNTLL